MLTFDHHSDAKVGVRRRDRREQVLTAFALAFTVGVSGVLAWSLGQAGVAEAVGRGWLGGLKASLFVASVGALIYGSIVYLVARLGWLGRSRAHRPATRAEIDLEVFDGAAEPMVVLVPAYREDAAVVRQTLLSAALQDYPNRRVVLLLDDPPASTDRATEAVRTLPRSLQATLAPMARRVRVARVAFEARRASGPLNEAEERLHLADLYEEAAEWFAEQARHEAAEDHTSKHFVAITFQARVVELREQSEHIRCARKAGGEAEECARAYRRLAGAFEVTIELFERKHFDNLSHEPNKAMNLNAYLALLGGTYQVLEGNQGRTLVPTRNSPDLVVPDAQWVLTLDADSLLVHDYATRLVQQIRQPGMERVAVIQTPYSAVPGAPTPVERVAGATTDIMHLVHRGMTASDATYWVGANALLRKSALEDIVTHTRERGHLVLRYIQDRTVIEDTESSIDLVVRGWSLFNYPERLAFSATPRDYGSLLVQRRRWANGGLIILPKLLRHLVFQLNPRHWLSALMRVHYLVSIASVNLSLLVLTSVPFSHELDSPLLPLTCIPYFALYARDLRNAGYRMWDITHIYALNLLLTPVNLGGVLKSLQQGLTGRRIPFGRTPKVASRTPAPALYILATFGILLLWTTGTVFDLVASRWSHATLAGINAAILAYAVTRFIGWRNCLDDVRIAINQRSGQRAKPQSPVATPGRHRLDTTPRRRPHAGANHRKPVRERAPSRI